ncbi:hypothetical protein CDV55_101035 [Aspergillus turcosus]|nr:hypothetical protein CDV55_101035 [Aspergillus turcosus]
MGKSPDAVVACVGGSNAVGGMFYPFSQDVSSVQLVGVEAAGDGLDTERHSGTLSRGSVGVLHGVWTYVLQNQHGQIPDTHSVPVGLDYPGVGDLPRGLGAIEAVKPLGPGKDLVLCLSGRGDKDVQTMINELPKIRPQIGWNLRFRRAKTEKYGNSNARQCQ